ncbi:MAG: ribokinase [Pseudobdellovibrionaceae bacterium]
MLIVFGYLGMDLILPVEGLPKTDGEPARARALRMLPSGKGGNQAFAAARFGAKVAMVGCVGDDDFGIELTDNLKRNGAMVTGVARSDRPTGTTLVVRDKAGHTQKTIFAGANIDTTHEQVPEEILNPQNYLLLQMELEAEQTLALLERAKARGTHTVMNLAPATSIPKKALESLDFLIVNSNEAAIMAEKLGLPKQDNALKLAQALSKTGDLTCIITSSRAGSYAVTPSGKAWHVPAYLTPEEDIIDISGAGDCYCGTFVAALHEGHILPDAMRYASVAASLSIRKEGTQSSFPFINEVETFLHEVEEAHLVNG